MILKRNFNPVRVVGYVRTELAFAILGATGVYALHRTGLVTVTVPFSIAAILGSALAIFIAFRNNSAYGRWWEARTLWGGMINASRVLARLVITFADSYAHQSNYDKARSDQFKRDLVYKVIAWAHALRLHLRREDDWTQLKPFFNNEEFAALQSAQHKPNNIHLLTGRRIYAAMADGTLGGYQGGLAMKKALLVQEGVDVDERGRVRTPKLYY